MSRRSAGEGTKRKRKKKDGSILWEYRLTLPGKRVSFYGDTEAEARRKFEEAKRLTAQGLPLLDDHLTVETYLTRWLAGRRNLRPTTRRRYQELVTHLIQSLGYVPLARLAPGQISQMYTEKERSGLSKTTVHHLHAVLHKALSDALIEGKVPYNATERLADPPRMPKHKTEALTQDEANQVLAYLEREQDRFEAVYILALTTGMREGEILALKWPDVHLDAPEPWLHVRATLHYGRERDGERMHFFFGTPKSENGERDLLLHPLAIEALHRHRARQKAERLKQGPSWDDSELFRDLLFTNGLGRPIEGTNFLKRSYYPMLEAAGVRRITFHDLRHSAATFLLNQGVPMNVVSKMLGHATAAFTMDRYGHARREDQAVAVQGMTRALRRK